MAESTPAIAGVSMYKSLRFHNRRSTSSPLGKGPEISASSQSSLQDKELHSLAPR